MGPLTLALPAESDSLPIVNFHLANSVASEGNDLRAALSPVAPSTPSPPVRC